MGIKEKMEERNRKKWEQKSEQIREVNEKRRKAGKPSKTENWGKMVDSGTGGLNNNKIERVGFLAQEQQQIARDADKKNQKDSL